MRYLLLLLFTWSLGSFAQVPVQGVVRDAKKKTPLSFCGVSVKGSTKSCIANGDGVFSLSANSDKDSLVFSFLGFKPRTVVAAAFFLNNTIYLESSEILIEEFVIHADDDYLYDIMNKGSKQMKATPSVTAKVYFDLETKYQQQAVEMLECYYNCQVNGNSIEDLRLKNGRIGLALTNDSSYFTSHNTSKAISYLNLTEANGYLPSVPFQFSRSKMRKHFQLKIIPPHEEDKQAWHIGFTPRKNDGTCFSGEVWLDKKTFALLKVNLNGENLSQHPFLPNFSPSTVDSVSIHITGTYDVTEKGSILNNLIFNYSLVYNSLSFRDRNLKRSISTKGIMYFYDINDPFILPYFNYDINQSDYRKITFLPYNAAFWENSKGLIYTEEQKSILAFLKQNGVLLNFNKTYSSDIRGIDMSVLKGKFFEDNNVLWSDTSRLSLKKNRLNKDSLEKLCIDRLKVKADLYHLKAQIFLDINPMGDTLQWYSATIFDVFETFYYLPEEQYTNCFLNIYFDLYEIGRRNMEKQLKSIAHPSRAQIDAIYQNTLAEIEVQTARYLKEVQSGRNYVKLEKWNNYVEKNLGIDNMRQNNTAGGPKP